MLATAKPSEGLKMPKYWKPSQLVRALRINVSGSTATMFAITLPIVVTFVGVAIDGARFFSARRQHANAIDTALLSAARQLQIDAGDGASALSVAAGIYQANLPKSLNLINNSIVFKQDIADTAVTYTGQAYIATTLMRVAGFTQLNVTTPAKATYSKGGANAGSNLEIALMLDVTGSMCDGGTGPCASSTKLDGTRQAATDLANIILGTSASSFTSRIALVPFSSTVRVGADGAANPLMQRLTNLPNSWSFWGPTYSNCSGSGGFVGEIWVGSGSCTTTPTLMSNWKLVPCVTERSFDSGIGFDPSDSPPGKGNWLLGHGGDRSVLSWDSSETAMTTFNGTTPAQMTYSWNYSPNGSGCLSQPGNEVLPLTANLTDVTERLQSLSAFGPTAGALGAVWTQYVLSPNWSGIWSTSQRPGSYGDTQAKQSNGAPVLRKVAIMLTDGGFNTSRQAASTDIAYMQTVSDRAISVCNNMKKNGIEIYTVAFDMSSLGGSEAAIAEATLKACGTDISHFYNSLTVSDLQSAFRDIAMKLSPIRLSQ
jgi:Flp pilus assembly protein TadG